MAEGTRADRSRHVRWCNPAPLTRARRERFALALVSALLPFRWPVPTVCEKMPTLVRVRSYFFATSVETVRDAALGSGIPTGDKLAPSRPATPLPPDSNYRRYKADLAAGSSPSSDTLFPSPTSVPLCRRLGTRSFRSSVDPVGALPKFACSRINEW